MAVIRPFKALRPAKELASKIAALPYDVYNRAEARAEVADDAYSFLNIDRPETCFPEDHDMYAEDVYEKAAQMLAEEEEKGWLVNDAEACFYIYELTMNGRVQSGLAALSSVDDYMNDVIRKHENTRPEKELDRFNHINVCSAQTGPIFLAYRSNVAIDTLIRACKEKEPEADFTSEDGIRHRIWKVDEPETITRFTKLFEQMPNTYIADGHHRAASAVSVSLLRRREHENYTGDEEFNYFLSVLFPSEELKIMDYNRLLKELNGFGKEDFLEALQLKFNIEPQGSKPYHPQKKGELGLFLGDKWYRLCVKPEFVIDDPVEGLDVAYLQREILAPVLGIKNPGADSRIEFIGGIRGLEELERRCKAGAKAAFAMYPTDINELFAVADAGRLMPPKSTWFEPKLRSGLFIHKIEK